jgi:hypothetical protein
MPKYGLKGDVQIINTIREPQRRSPNSIDAAGVGPIRPSEVKASARRWSTTRVRHGARVAAVNRRCWTKRRPSAFSGAADTVKIFRTVRRVRQRLDLLHAGLHGQERRSNTGQARRNPTTPQLGLSHRRIRHPGEKAITASRQKTLDRALLQQAMRA